MNRSVDFNFIDLMVGTTNGTMDGTCVRFFQTSGGLLKADESRNQWMDEMNK